MTEEIPAASSVPECNGSVPPEQGPLQLTGVVEETAKSIRAAPYVNAGMSPEAPPAEEEQEEDRNSLAEDTARGGCDGEKQCEEKQEESDGTLQQGSADSQDPGTDGRQSEEGLGGGGTSAGSGERELGPAASPGGEAAETPAASPDGRWDAAEEEEEEEEEVEEEEEDTEEDEVQVIEIKENSEASCLKQQDSGQEASPPTSPSCNSQAEKPGDQPSLGKKNDISRHSYSRYNTISYRRIRKGNTKQRIDEFESMMHL